MSGQGKQGGGGQGDQGSQGGKQTYVVKTDFVDDKGRQWAVGSVFSGDEAAIRKAVAAGQVEPKPAE